MFYLYLPKFLFLTRQKTKLKKRYISSSKEMNLVEQYKTHWLCQKFLCKSNEALLSTDRYLLKKYLGASSLKSLTNLQLWHISHYICNSMVLCVKWWRVWKICKVIYVFKLFLVPSIISFMNFGSFQNNVLHSTSNSIFLRLTTKWIIRCVVCYLTWKCKWNEDLCQILFHT